MNAAKRDINSLEALEKYLYKNFNVKGFKKIDVFLQKHHGLTFVITDGTKLSTCSLLYADDAQKTSFVVAGSHKTTHIKNITNNPKIAGTVVLETKNVPW